MFAALLQTRDCYFANGYAVNALTHAFEK